MANKNKKAGKKAAKKTRSTNKAASGDFMEAVRGAAEVGRASFPDQIDFYDPDKGDIR